MLPFLLRFRFVCLGVLLVFAGGCGVDEYQKKMLKAQDDLVRFEEEKRMLTDPITVPTRPYEGTEVPIANIFLRLPRGIYTQPDTKTRENILFFYAPSTEDAKRPIAKVELAGAKDQQEEKAFITEVLNCFAKSGSTMTRTQQFRIPDSDLTNTFSTYRVPERSGGRTLLGPGQLSHRLQGRHRLLDGGSEDQ